MQDPREQNKKVKTKAAMLEELESLRGLLLEEDEIPILQEVIEPHPATNQVEKPLSSQALHQLQDDFKALSQAMTEKQQAIKASQPAQSAASAATSASLLEAFTRASQQHAQTLNKPATTTKAVQEDLPLNFDGVEEPSLKSAEPGHSEPEKPVETEKNEEKPADRWSTQKTSPARPALTKAQGENPFLPQHIRARLHGNRPLPSFDLPKVEPVANPKIEDMNQPASRQALVDALVEASLPRIERELRDKLATLSQETLKRLLNES